MRNVMMNHVLNNDCLCLENAGWRNVRDHGVFNMKEETVKKLFVAAILVMCVCISTQSYGEEKTVNLLEGALYNDEGMGKVKLVDEDYLLLMQIALKPGQSVPGHKANSNVHFIVLEGEVVLDLDGKEIIAKKGDLVPVAFKTPMNISNKSSENTTFVVIKTPSPGQMEKCIEMKKKEAAKAEEDGKQ